jgi:predicted DsbA family dithiol-disulfide isomerase
MAPKAATTNPRSFHDYLAERLPAGISVPFAEKSLTEAGRELGLEFHFEKGANIADLDVLSALGAEAGLGEKTLQTFRDTREGDAALVGSEERLRGFGVRTVPNLLFGGRVLVPGTVNVATYVHALDQALFPSSDEEAKDKPTLH